MVYTPQFTLNSRDYRRGLLRDDFGERIAEFHRQKPKAALQLALAAAADSIAVSGVCLTALDITKPEQAEAAVRAAVDRFAVFRA